MHRRLLLQHFAAGASAALASSCSSTPTSSPQARVSLGIDQLAKAGFAPLLGRRVGFVTNQTSVNGAGTMSRVVLQQGLGANLKLLFGPEHGLDTRAKAGDLVANAQDEVTGLRAYSLYGEHRKPTSAMLADVDVLVFDIQDIGVRSYTYISTMALAMEAAGQEGKDFVVLDRPNPLGGMLVEGPPVQDAFRSFVSQIPVPYRHGMTIGELAKMMIAKGWIKANPRLTVIPMTGWRRSMNWQDTKLNWVPTSPNIPFWDTPFYCAATGILGELKDVDIGIGTGKPFHYAAARGIDGAGMAAALTEILASKGLTGFSFIPYISKIKPGFSGVEVIIDPTNSRGLMAVGMLLIHEIVRRTNGAVLAASPANTLDLLNKVYGSEALLTSLRDRTLWLNLVNDWELSLQTFKQQRAEYLLYD